MNALFFALVSLLWWGVGVNSCDIRVKHISVDQVPPGGKLSSEDVRHALSGHGSQVAAPAKHYWSCIDGRATEAVFGTPGGDAGELLLGLAVLNNDFGGQSLVDTVDEVIALVYRFIDENITRERSFYMHTDQHAAKAVREGLPIEAHPDFDLLAVPEKYQERALELLTDPVPEHNMGCGHLRMALKYPEQYNVPSTCTAGLVRAIFRAAWDVQHPIHNKLHLHLELQEAVQLPPPGHDHDLDSNAVSSEDVRIKVLEGNHAEQAVVYVHTAYHTPQEALSSECAEALYTRGAMTVPLRMRRTHMQSQQSSQTSPFTSFFTVHAIPQSDQASRNSGGPELIGSFRRQMATFFTGVLREKGLLSEDGNRNGDGEGGDAHRFRMKLNALAASHFQHTAHHLKADTKPAFVATLTLEASQGGADVATPSPARVTVQNVQLSAARPIAMDAAVDVTLRAAEAESSFPPLFSVMAAGVSTLALLGGAVLLYQYANRSGRQYKYTSIDDPRDV